jgi:hypothetical protein
MQGATTSTRNLKRERLGKRAHQQPALAVFELGPIFIGPQDSDRDVVAEAPQMGHQQLAGQAGAEGWHVLKHHGCGHSLADERHDGQKQVARVAQFRLAGQALLRASEIRMAGAGNAPDEHIELREFGRVQGTHVRLDQRGLGMLCLPFVGKVRFELDAGDNLEGRIARQRRRQGAAARKHFEHAERWRQRATALNGEGSM